MAKKSFTSGIDALLSPTTKNDVTPDEPVRQPDDKPSRKPVKLLNDDALIPVHFRMPQSLKVKMEHYCTDNRLKQQELITSAIQQFIQ